MKQIAKIGDIVNGWKIIDVYSERLGTQNVKMAVVESTIETHPGTKSIRLTKLTNKQVGWPDRRRPDNIQRNTTHGMSQDRLYRIWAAMKDRCSNKNALTNYTKLGITVCDDWLKFENFKSWAEKNGYNKRLTLDRIDSSKDYCPENCRWATMQEQAANKGGSLRLELTAWGETKSFYEWLHDERCKVTIYALKYRIGAGWNPEEAISIPPARGRKLGFEEWVKRNKPEVYQEYLDS
jgi:hypothetical protein